MRRSAAPSWADSIARGCPWLVCALAALVTVWDPRPGHADAVPGDHVDRLIQRSRAKHLSRFIEWRRLGHWRDQGRDAAYAPSEVDGARFFLAEDGKHAPRSELEATLRAFAAAPGEGGDDHARCRFPARFIWLDSKLDLSAMPRVACPGYERFREDVAADTVSVVFASFYAERPASAFGHTFLVLGRTGRARLLDFAINFGALVNTGNPVLYAIRGTTGGFVGRFTRHPFHDKVREYNDREKRDLVEYRLALTQDQVDFLAAHLWELGQTYFDYWFLTENCSYHLLGVLEVLDPRWDLLRRVHWPVLPTDAIKALMATPGLVAEVHWQPSTRRQFRERAARLSHDERALMDALLADPERAFPRGMGQEREAAILDAAIDLATIRHGGRTKSGEERAGPGARIRQTLLLRRARLPVVSDPLDRPPRDQERPDKGHGSRRLGMGVGVSQDGQWFASTSIRANLHDLLDPTWGYPELSQIEFLYTEVRAWSEGRVRVEDLWAVRMLHLNPRDRVNRDLSWMLRLGTTRPRAPVCTDCLTPTLAGGAGLTETWLGDGLAVYALAEVQLMGTRHFAATGARGGVRLRLAPNLIATLDARWLLVPTAFPSSIWSLDAALRWALVPDLALGLDAHVQEGAPTARISAFVYY